LAQAGLVSVGAVLHLMVRPVHSKYFELSEKIEKEEEARTATKLKI
jgi:hypothetical protein